LGCATEELAADAKPSGDGWLVALANGAPLGDPGCAGGASGALATQIQLARLDGAGSLTPGATGGALGPELRGHGGGGLAPRPDGGALLVWCEPDVPDRRAALVDASGQLAGAGFSVSAPVVRELESPSAGWFGADRVGEDFAVAWLVGLDVGACVAPQV